MKVNSVTSLSNRMLYQLEPKPKILADFIRPEDGVVEGGCPPFCLPPFLPLKLMGRRHLSLRYTTNGLDISTDYKSMLAVVRRPTLSLISSRKERRSTVDFSLQQIVSYGIGSGPGGRSVSYIACSNDRATGEDLGRCTMVAQLSCAQVRRSRPTSKRKSSHEVWVSAA
jgi:hypothetical protein